MTRKLVLSMAILLLVSLSVSARHPRRANRQPAAPATPTSFTVTASPWLQVYLTWAADDTEDHVEIERAPFSGSCGTFAKIGETNRSNSSGVENQVHPLGLSGRAYTDESVADNTAYCYRARATNVDGNSAYTAEVQVTSTNTAGTPTANAGADQSLLLGEPVGFDGTASTNVYRAEWTFGDNKLFPYSVARNVLKPAHLYLAAGVYVATLTTYNTAGASASDTVQITVTAIADATGADLVDMGLASNPCSPSSDCEITNLTDGDANWTKFKNAINYVKTRNTSNPQRIIIPEGAILNVLENYALPVPTGSKYITIEGEDYATLYMRGTRLTFAQTATMPQLKTTVSTAQMNTAATAHHYRFRGLQWTQTDSALTLFWYIALGGDAGENSAATVGHHFLFEHCAFIQPSNREIQRAIGIFTNDTSVSDSYIRNIKHTGNDSQAISIHVGARITLVNNLLQGSTENVLTGGHTPAFDVVPESITLKRNHIEKPIEWFPGPASNPNGSYAGTRYTVKNLFELKTGRDIVVAGNYFDRTWANAQQYSVLIRAGVDTGNAQTENIWFAYNKLSKMSQAFEVTSYENVPRGVRRVLIEQNIFEDVDPDRWYDSNLGAGFSSGLVAIYNGATDLRISHISIVKHSTTYKGQAIVFDRTTAMPKYVRFSFKDSVHFNNDTGSGYYVWNARSAEAGNPGLINTTDFSPSGAYTGNLFGEGANPPMPAGNYYVTLANFAAQFDDYAGGVYTIASSSAANNGASDGTDPGADIAAVSSAISGAVSGVWSATSGGATGKISGRVKMWNKIRVK